MISITALLWISVVFYFVLGIRRGWRDELLSSALIIMAFVSIFLLDGWLRNHILRFASLTYHFVVEITILVVLFFLSHFFFRSLVRPKSSISTGWRSYLFTLHNWVGQLAERMDICWRLLSGISCISTCIHFLLIYPHLIRKDQRL